MGAAGRDFHNFNVAFRDDPAVEVVTFTATQIPYISGRLYPASLAGPLYPKGIPIAGEEGLADLLRRERIDEVVFAYSDVPHELVMHRASVALAGGADFAILGPRATMLDALVPVVAVCASRTGAGKSQTTRRVVRALREAGRAVVVVRHPMPYGDLEAQRCQRFATFEDLDAAGLTVEEREEYEPHVRAGTVVYAGVDYVEILGKADAEADVIVWDGGNNDLPFYRPDVHIVVVDPLRAGHERAYHPGEANVRMADAIVINKVDSASPEQLAEIEASIAELNPRAQVVRARSPITVEGPAMAGRRVLVVEDGPTLTHGGMSFGAGVIAARRAGAQIIDPRPWAAGTVADTYRRYPEIGPLLPATGYSPEQLRDLADTINRSPAELVVVATPVDLRRLVSLRPAAVRVTYELEEVGAPTIPDVLAPVLARGEAAGAPAAGPG
ncbi:MAG: GTPase [Acidobacteria bacterium]|nr:GTPase [Acidobacteriota bacterium]